MAFPLVLRAPVPPDPFLASRATRAVDALIEAGVARLVAEPWRVSRLIRGADNLSFEYLAREVARRRALPPPSDFNRALALAQLARAVETPAFVAAWISRSAAAEPVRAIA